MKSNKLSLNILMTVLLVTSVFLASAPKGYAQEADQGWSEPVNLSVSGAASNPVMVIDMGGTIHAIWLDDVDEGYQYSQSSDGGVTWSVAIPVKFPFGPKDPPPVLLADTNGSIHLFWLAVDGGLFYGQTTPFEFADPGKWKTTTRLGRDIKNFDVVLDASGVLHIAYVRSSTTPANPAGIYYRQSIIGGGFWSEPGKLYETEYFRSAKESDVYIRISTSNTLNDQKVYVTWDNRAQKRVFMAVSNDSGVTWGAAQQMKGPEDTGGIDTPFNLTASAFGNNVLLIWQSGDPGSSKCTIYSQWSQDGGVNWGDTVAVLGGRSECPVSTKVVGRDDSAMAVIFEGEVSPIMVAWNGAEWSDPQSQTQLPSFVNPLTFDAILLGCRFDLITTDRLYVVGCDQGRGGDVWFLSRPLESVEKWFSPSVIWGEPVVLTARSENPERITNFYAAPDDGGNIHAVWVQSPIVQGEDPSMTIEYARWDGIQWTTPESVFGSLSSKPMQLSVTADPLDRLLLTWIDGYNGDLIFSWANLEKANLSSEWEDTSGLPSPSRLINSADLVVDGSGRIVDVYVIPINENRGIYITQSTDGGKNWSSPVRVFDAVAEGWERIEQPRISIGADGVLHLVFIRSSVREGQAVGLYYSRSTDGGTTWSKAQVLSEGEIEWADLVSYEGQAVHVVWQEYDGLVYANISQISQDGGLTWGKQNNVTGVNETPTRVSLASDGRGLLHFVQLVSQSNVDAYNQKSFLLQDWKWDGAAWGLDLTKDFIIKGEDVTYSLSADITSTGFLGVFIPVEYIDPAKAIKSEVLTFSRFLEDNETKPLPSIPVIPTFDLETGGGETTIVQPTPTPDFSVLYDDNVSSSPLQQNIVGLVLIGVGVIATIVLIVWRRPAKNKE